MIHLGHRYSVQLRGYTDWAKMSRLSSYSKKYAVPSTLSPELLSMEKFFTSCVVLSEFSMINKKILFFYLSLKISGLSHR